MAADDARGGSLFRALAGAAGLLLAIVFLYLVRELLLLLFLAVLFSVYLNALTEWFRRKLALPRPLGILLSLTGTLVGLGGVVALLVPRLTRQAAELLSALPAQMMRWERTLADVLEQYPLLGDLVGPLQEGQSYFGTVFREVGQYFTDVFPYLFSGLWFLVHLVSFFAISIYLTARPGLYRNEVLQLVAPARRELAADILDDLGATLRAWVGGQLLAMFVLGALTWVGLELLEVPFALAFAVFAGLAAIVPFFGTLVSTLLPALYVLPSDGLLYALAVAGVGGVVHLVEANVVAPMIFERRVELPPAWTLLTLLVMVKLLGAIGLLVAVPVFAAGRVFVQRVYIDRTLESAAFRPANREAPIPIRVPADGALRLEHATGSVSVPGALEERDER